METTFSPLIDGELVAGRRPFEGINPATGAPFAALPPPTREDLPAAMAAPLPGRRGAAKPPPCTPLPSLALGAAPRAAVPAGVVNVLGGSDEVGAWMTAHPAVRKISFTGSVPTGKKIMRAAADDLKRVTLELGGNDPAIVLPDVDPARVAPKLFWGAFTNSGQVCVAIKRLYVHEDVYRPVLEALTQLAKQVKVGDGLQPDTQLGPINNQPQFSRVQELVEDARRAGGTVVAGGAALSKPGYFYPPTIVTDVGEGVRLVDEEQFGPAPPVLPYRDLDDALAQANRTHYGLGGSVWTNDVARGEEIAQRLECGTAWVNQHMNIGAKIPFGGVKWSGLGRENGKWGIEEFCELQAVSAARA